VSDFCFRVRPWTSATLGVCEWQLLVVLTHFNQGLCHDDRLEAQVRLSWPMSDVKFQGQKVQGYRLDFMIRVSCLIRVLPFLNASIGAGDEDGNNTCGLVCNREFAPTAFLCVCERMFARGL
jgi:hypothetical protein